MRLLFIGLVIFFSCFTEVSAKDKITWMVLDWPPWMMLEGEDKGEGRFNYILNEVHENLPQYEHSTVKMNWARFWHEVKNKKNICYVFGLKSGKRADLVYYSEPHTLVLPNAIIMKKETVEKLGNPDTYSIVKLLQDKRFKGYAEKNRSFTATIDNVLKQHEPGSNLERVSESPESLIKMVKAGRIDYTIEYPIVASYYDRKQDNPGDIAGIPIAEMEPFAYVHMCCTKNEWGKKVIESWNEVLHRIKPTPEYRRITEIGHTDENEIKLIRQYYEDFLKAK